MVSQNRPKRKGLGIICKHLPFPLRSSRLCARIIGSTLPLFLEVRTLKTPFGFLVRLLNRCTDQSMTHALETMDLTAAQGRIMAYLAHSKMPPCPRDIESEFHLSHPTVSGILSRLEQKSFIELRPDPEDRRCKRIYVLEKGRQCHALMHKTIRENEQRMVDGFTPEEQARFAEYLQRAITNMGGSPCRPMHKEEETE